MQTYKYSQFNLVIQETEDKVLLYNTYSLRWRRFNKSDFERMVDQQAIPQAWLSEYIIKEGFMVPTNLNEIQRLKDDVNTFWEDYNTLDLSIFVTMACNYRCVYCFEKDHLCNTEYMTTETADDIINFIKRRYAEHQFKNKLHIKWFGGEPLLNMPIIRYISNELHSNNIDFIARMYTNGRLLTKEITQELKDLGVTGPVVIPIDGLASTYAKLKCCKEEDFHAVIQNIKAAEDILNIIIHINVSEASKADTEALYKYLREEVGLKCKIKINNITPSNTNYMTIDNTINMTEYFKLVKDITPKRSIKRSFGCEAKNPNHFGIGVNGEIHFCEYTIKNKEHIAGNIVKECTNPISRVDTTWDINKIIDQCHECNILPLCMGECVMRRYINKVRIDCDKELYTQNIKERLLKIIDTQTKF